MRETGCKAVLDHTRHRLGVCRDQKIGNDVEKYSFDPLTGVDRVEKLDGSQSLAWRRVLCTPSSALIKAGIGQTSRACQKILKQKHSAVR